MKSVVFCECQEYGARVRCVCECVESDAVRAVYARTLIALIYVRVLVRVYTACTR